MTLKLVEKKKETSDVTSFIFETEMPINWQAGQYLKYFLQHEHPDDRGTERYFTISAAPQEGKVMITTRHAQEKGSTFKDKLFSLNIGETIEAEGPRGSFVLEDLNKEYVFIAGGIGITPFHSILKDLAAKGQSPKITLLYANRNQEVVFKSEFDKLEKTNPNLKIVYIFDPQKIDQQTIKANVPNIKSPLFYVSGPEPMVEALGEILKKMGISEDHIKQDFFPGYTD